MEIKNLEHCLNELLKKDGNFKITAKFGDGRIGEYETNGNISYFQCVNGKNKFYHYRDIGGKKVTDYEKVVYDPAGEFACFNRNTWEICNPVIPTKKDYFNTNLFAHDFGKKFGGMQCIGSDYFNEGLEFIFGWCYEKKEDAGKQTYTLKFDIPENYPKNRETASCKIVTADNKLNLIAQFWIDDNGSELLAKLELNAEFGVSSLVIPDEILKSSR